MYTNDLYTPDLEWVDVAPIIFELHDYSLDPYMVRWPRLAWPALEQEELTGASSEVERLDTTIRAISLTHFHLQFLCELNLSVLDMDYDAWLEDIVTADQILLLLKSKYDWQEHDCADYRQKIDKAFFAVYPYHLQQIMTAVYDYFGSIDDIFDLLVETSIAPGDRDATFWQLLSAGDFLRGALSISIRAEWWMQLIASGLGFLHLRQTHRLEVSA